MESDNCFNLLWTGVIAIKLKLWLREDTDRDKIHVKTIKASLKAEEMSWHVPVAYLLWFIFYTARI